jgi:pimeloyl-ACP methyl ester carboxylesterase
MGSMVAQSFALAHPELVLSLCLIGSACTLSDSVRQAQVKVISGACHMVPMEAPKVVSDLIQTFVSHTVP